MIEEILSKIDFLKIIYTLGLVIIAFIIYRYIAKHVKKAVMSKIKGKKQISNVKILFNLMRYTFFIIIALIVIFSFTGSFAGLGISAGLLTAALGWALQRPITGIAGWIMVITKKPFQIGDRISIGSIKGDVSDITLTHIYLGEVGGTINTEENSGRTVMVPNSTLFEQNIINYTLQDEYILDEVGVLITYESDLDKAVELCKESAKKITKEWKDRANIGIRTFFADSGIQLKTRYFTKANERVKVASDMTREIFDNIRKEKKVGIAYPHTEIIYNK